MEELKESKCITEEFYYSTNKIYLVHEESLDANFNSNNVFEYGNGIYLTNDECTSKQYISRNLLEDIAKDPNFDFSKIKNAKIKIGKLHKYGVKLSTFKENESYVEIDSLEKLKKELKDSINGYITEGLNIGYKPNDRYFTYGFLVGQPWDDYWKAFFKDAISIEEKNDKLSKITSKEIERLIARCCINLNYNIKQICIHRNSKLINETIPELKNLDSNYFSYLGDCDIQYIANS